MFLKYLPEARAFFLQTFLAELLIIWALYLGYALISLLISKKEKQSVALRFCSIAVAVAWWLTVVFHVLLALHSFLLPLVCGFAMLSGLIAHFTILPFSEFLQLLIHDARLLGTWFCRSVRRSPVVAVLFALHIFLMTTMLLYPSTGWDSMVYHLTKAGFWIQNGAPFSFNIPGAWDAYINFFGGGEIFTAWAMLPFHGDFAVALLDLLLWELFGFGIYALARELDVPGPYAWLAAWFIWFTPGVFRWMGTSYIDIRMQAFLMISLALIARFFKKKRMRELALIGMAAGVAAGCKITSLPLVFAFSIFLLIGGLWRAQNRRIFLNAFSLALLLAASVCAPWMIYNTLETGYPLSPFPLHFAGITVGKGSTSMYLGMRVLHGTPYKFADELRSLFPLLLACGGTIGFFPIALLPISLSRFFYKKPMMASVISAAILGQIAFYWSPAFSSARIWGSQHNGRFLLLVIALATILLLSAEPRLKKIFAACLCLMSARLLFFFVRGMGERSSWLLLISFFLIALAYGKAWFAFSLRTTGKVMIILLVMLPMFLLPYYFFSQNHRYQVLSHKRWLRNYAKGAQPLDDKKSSHRIALAVSADGHCHQFFYPFMGSRLQNRLFYIPITRGGEIIHVQDGNYENKPISFYVWLARLKENHISHVACFSPSSIELRWIRHHPQFFNMLVGKLNGADSLRWGLFEVLDEPKK